MNKLPVSYSVGFLVSPDGQEVLLLRKARPSFIANTWGAFGGHIEIPETPFETMVREAKEEADLPALPWTHLGVVNTCEKQGGPIGSAQIVMFAARGDVHAARALTDEPLGVFPIDQVESLNLSATTRLILPRLRQFARGELEGEFTPPTRGNESDHLYAVRLSCSVWGVNQQLEISRCRSNVLPVSNEPVLSCPTLRSSRIQTFGFTTQARCSSPKASLR